MMEYTRNILKEKLKSGEKVFGTWSIIPSPTALNIIASSGIDFIIIDMEHGSVDYESLPNLMRAIESGGSQAVVRLPNSNNDTILKVLESGIKSILIPHVSSIEEAERIVKACKYHPEGDRGLSPYTINHGYHHNDLDLKKANDEILVGVMLEGEDCIRLAMDIPKIEGIDLIYMGIYDISQALKCPCDLYNDRIIEAQQRSAEYIQDAGKSAGSFARDIEYAGMLYENGFQFISYLVDCSILKSAYVESIEKYNSLNDRVE